MANKYFQDLKISFQNDTDNNAKITAEPFDRGYAVTVGNGLRRTLLTSLPGAAITSVKISTMAEAAAASKGCF